MRTHIFLYIAVCLWSINFCRATEPSSVRSEEELLKVFPNAKKEIVTFGEKKIVVLYMYSGSGFIRQVVHIFTKAEGADDLFWKVSMVLNSRKGVVRVSKDGTQLEIITEKGKTVALLDSSLLSSDKSEFLSP